MKTLKSLAAQAVAQAKANPITAHPSSFSGPKSPNSTPVGMGTPLSGAPMGMATRKPVIANKARGTMASHTYSQIPNSMSGMGSSPYSYTSNMGTPLKGGTRVGKSLPTFLQ